MFTIKAFVRAEFRHRGFEASTYEIDEVNGLVIFQGAKGENWPILSLGDYSRIVVENSAGKTVDNLYDPKDCEPAAPAPAAPVRAYPG